MKRLVLAVLVLGSAATVALAQGGAPRTPLPARVTAKLGMLNVPALSPLWLLPEYAAAYNIQIETVMFQRFADGRTALASGDLDITAFGPQDITLAVAQGARSLVGVAGVGSGNDCLLVRRGEDIRDWKELGTRKIGIGAGSISWLKFAASVQEHGVDYGKLRITNIVGGGANYLKALQGKEIDLAVVWQPFCAQGLVDGYAQYPTLDHNRSKAVGGLIAVLAVNCDFMEKHPDAVQRLVVAYLDVLKFAQANPQRWSMIYAEKAGLPEPVAAESIRITRLDATLPLASIARISKFLSDNGVITRDVSGEIARHYTYEFLSKATGKSPVELGQNHQATAVPRRGPWFALLPLALLLLWHAAVTRQWVAPGIIPAPAQVAASWSTWIVGPPGKSLSPYSGTWLANVLYSSRRVFEGFLIAAGVGIPLGLMIGWNRLASTLVDPSIQLLRPVPITAWLPFSIAVFGIYDAGALFLIGLGAFYPIVVNTTHGVRDTNLLLLRAARMLGASETTILRKVVFPSALPSIFTRSE